jgi:hypothetical protein
MICCLHYLLAAGFPESPEDLVFLPESTDGLRAPTASMP